MEFWINDTLLDQSWSLETLLCWMEILRYAYWQKLLTVVGWILCIFCFYCGHFESVQRRFTPVLLYSRFFFQKCLFKRQIFSKLVVSSKCWFRVFVWRSRQEAYSQILVLITNISPRTPSQRSLRQATELFQHYPHSRVQSAW